MVAVLASTVELLVLDACGAFRHPFRHRAQSPLDRLALALGLAAGVVWVPTRFHHAEPGWHAHRANPNAFQRLRTLLFHR